MPQTYKFIRNGVAEKVQREAWRWQAHYTDGSVLKQFDDDGIFHQFAEIDQSRLMWFKMVHDTAPEQILIFPEGAKLVHKYINTILNAGTVDERRIRLYAFGYQLNGQNHFIAILPDNTVVVTDDFNNIRIA